MIRHLLLGAILVALGGCADFPRDPEQTSQRVRVEGQFRVGIVAPLAQGPHRDRIAALLTRVGAAAKARPLLADGDAEPLLKRLEDGELDLVIGRFESSSPYKKHVSFSPPLQVERQGKAKIQLVAAMRNGENAWIGLVEREARNLGDGS